MKSTYSVTQLSNLSVAAGVLVMALQYFGYVVPQDKLTFILASLWTLGSQAVAYYGRYKKGDLTLGGFRKK